MDDDAEHGAPNLAACTGRDDAAIHVEVLDPHVLVTGAERVRLEEWLHAAILASGASGAVRVRLVADPEMATAHERYAGVEGTTDVLTFDMRDEDEDLEPGAGMLDVDVWACVDEARRQAGPRGLPVERELLLYCLHGVLHCLGYDDHDEAEFARMHAEEDRILEAIGVGRTFATSEVERR
jgi:rRNA maturation RNase YbeY